MESDVDLISLSADEEEETTERPEAEPKKEKTGAGTIESGYGCLRGRIGCSGSPLKIGKWKNLTTYVCPCGYDTIKPPSAVAALTEKEG
jgi:hypothetical protein